MNEDEEPKIVKRSHSVSSKKNFIKIKRKAKKKKLIFDELSFVESHVDTFYCLNDVQGACNPITAKLIDPDEECVKEWVHPDTQLVKPKQRILKFENFAQKGKYRPLDLVNEKDRLRTPQKCTVKNLFDDLNETVRKSELTIASPTKHRIFIDDTPVQYYGLSTMERRIRGLRC
ncbi:hypothetical protein BpHYR1_040908 [Brachionus plicatilis]|uniref:Uncharacterized protein n=1 Tax=Brachionus plicatilis TaxID=10195 RepID=A0A3M7QJB8_BRAPC|nr:hypothetical protein BpHYR1_040908 [Brachionus plicatilis]